MRKCGTMRCRRSKKYTIIKSMWLIAWVLIFISLVLFFNLFFRHVFNWDNLGISFSVAHLCLILIISFFVYTDLYEPQIEFFWFIPTILDFPITILYSIFLATIIYFLGDLVVIKSFWVPLLFFGILGSVLYYCIGVLVMLYLRRFNIIK